MGVILALSVRGPRSTGGDNIRARRVFQPAIGVTGSADRTEQDHCRI